MASINTAAPIDVKSFVKETYDKFNDNRETSFVWPPSMDNIFYEPPHKGDVIVGDVYNVTLTLRRLKNPNLDATVIEYNYVGKEWGFIRDGKLVINLDGTTNITLVPMEGHTDAREQKVYETGYYVITEENLDQICSSSVVELKITGGKFATVIDNKPVYRKGMSYGEKFLFMCRAFCAGINNDETYMDYFAKIVSTSDVESKKVKSSGRFANGCLFVVSALLFLFIIYTLFYKHR